MSAPQRRGIPRYTETPEEGHRRRAQMIIEALKGALQGDKQKMARTFDQMEGLPSELPPTASRPARKIASTMKKLGHNMRVLHEARDRLLDELIPPDPTKKTLH